jgi:hypothetical protein
LWSFRYDGTINNLSDFTDHTAESGVPGTGTSLGTDANGEIYVCRGAYVYRLVPSEMYLNVPPLVVGSQAIMNVSNAAPNSPTYLAYSFSGLGSTLISQLSVVLSLNQPGLAATSTSNSSGVAQYQATPPPGLFGRTIWMQAVQTGTASNVFEATFN